MIHNYTLRLILRRRQTSLALAHNDSLVMSADQVASDDQVASLELSVAQSIKT